MTRNRTATLYPMVLPEEIFPFGVKAKKMLEENGYAIDEHILRSREAVDTFEPEHGVDATPQVFVDGERIGGSDDLKLYISA